MNQHKTDMFFMKQALLLAESAAQIGEVPVGALITLHNDIVGKGENCPISTNDPCAHAEIIAIREAARNCNNYRIPGTTLYVTLEPCIMCMGAVIHSRIKRVVFGAYDPKTGAAGSRYSIGSDNRLNHHVNISGGICEEECAHLIKTFFRERRKSISTDCK